MNKNKSLKILDSLLRDIKKFIKEVDPILTKKEKKALYKVYKKRKDFELAFSWGWEWEGNHFHKPNGTVVRRTDYIK